GGDAPAGGGDAPAGGGSSTAVPGTVTATLGGGVDPTIDFQKAVGTETATGARLDNIAPNVFNLMCIPDLPLQPLATQVSVYQDAGSYCEDNQAFLIIDPPAPAAAYPTGSDTVDTIGGTASPGLATLMGTWASGILGADRVAAAAYYPWIQIVDPVTGLPRLVPPSGTVAGIYATTDTNRGVWKAPAGVEAGLNGVVGLADTTITDDINGQLNVVGINVIRTFPVYGTVVWGARTTAGADLIGSAFKYVPVRRLTDYIEQSLQQSLKWAVFEPNGPALWASISLEVTSFMAGLFGAGAFAGASAASAYSVACDASTTSPTDMLEGKVNVNVAFAPVDPAEFVMLNIQIDAASAAS
ncbi:MAG TPA: phage tail sheath C-terminal domain-containing protein, partial [Solirubrobacteraceae bacterium]|nr:phage tail sheath C-terminal domain-containing protein [Solirubrobacteraceae bacterium]